MTKIVQMLHDLRTSPPGTEIVHFRQYVARVATNVCIDFLRAKWPARARLKNNLRDLVNRHRDFALWEAEGEVLRGLAAWQDTDKSVSSERQLLDLEEKLPVFLSTRFAGASIKHAPTHESRGRHRTNT